MVGRAKQGIHPISGLRRSERVYVSDRSQPLPKVAGGKYQSLDPVQPPISPPYKRALDMKKAVMESVIWRNSILIRDYS